MAQYNGRRQVNEHCFWVTNVSEFDVSLADLALKIPSRRSMNLLDSKHFHYTLEQLEKSAKEGSIYKKSDKIKVRNVPPKPMIKPGLYVLNEPRDTKLRSSVKIIEKKYEELSVSDEKYAEDFVKDPDEK